MILYLTLFVLMVLTILTVQFRYSASHARSTAFRLEQDECIRQISEAAMDEAFMAAWREAETVGSRLRTLLMEEPGRSVCPIELPVSSKFSSASRKYLQPEIRAAAKVFDVRQTDLWGQPYYNQERVGTLEITVTARFKPLANVGVPNVTCRMIRHHDFKVVSMLSTSSRPGGVYAHNHLLDYALFVRSGLEEFRSSNGFSANHRRARLKIRQPDGAVRGKVFFGGTSPDGPSAAQGQYPEGRYVFFNTAFSPGNTGIPDTTGFIPLPGKHPDKIVDGADCHKLFPRIMQVVEREKRKALQKATGPFAATIRSKINAKFAQVKAELMKLQGKFHIRDVPVHGCPDPDLEKMKGAVENYLLENQYGAGANMDPGVEILETAGNFAFDPANADAVLEGDIRQRFLHMVHFELDASRVDPQIITPQFRAELQDVNKQWPCVRLSGTALAGLGEKQNFYSVLEDIEARIGGPGESVLSHFEESFPLKGGLEYALVKDPAALAQRRFHTPAFYDRKGVRVSSPIPPYSHRNLFTLAFPTTAELVAHGIYDPKSDPRYEILNLRGIIDVKDSIELGRTGKKVLINGRGVLIASNSIDIFSGIVAPEPALGILVARGQGINVFTDQEIQAGLIALNPTNDGVFRTNQPLKVTGMVAADRLNLEKWYPPEQENIIAYDSRLKTTEDVYAVSLSRQITFQRMENAGMGDQEVEK
jgi:hypothetical protein